MVTHICYIQVYIYIADPENPEIQRKIIIWLVYIDQAGSRLCRTAYSYII